MMDKVEAKQVLASELARYRSRSYHDLVALIGHPQVCERRGASGAEYQIELQAVWDNRLAENVRVIASVDDGGWNAFFPLTESFLMSPAGTFIED